MHIVGLADSLQYRTITLVIKCAPRAQNDPSSITLTVEALLDQTGLASAVIVAVKRLAHSHLVR